MILIIIDLGVVSAEEFNNFDDMRSESVKHPKANRVKNGIGMAAYKIHV